MNLWKRLFGGLQKGKPKAATPNDDLPDHTTPEQHVGRPKPDWRIREDRINTMLFQQGLVYWLALECNRQLHLPISEEIDDSSQEKLNRSLQCYFDRTHQEMIQWVEEMGGRHALALTAPALLLYGRLEMVETILDNVARESYHTDHGAGKCNLFPYLAIQRALPIPVEIYFSTGTSGYVKVEATREWFHANRDRLEWSEENRRFEFRDEQST